MTGASESNRPGSFVRSWLPWLLAAGMLVVYLATLNRWLSIGNVAQVVEISGWNWNSNLFHPVFYLITWPLRWIPTSLVPLALNAFSAICAALAIALLARSVALLPHDRTHDQRQRVLNEHSLLSFRTAWLPPVLAILVCGFQLTFWEHATDSTGVMFDLLIFAYLVRCLLEFRLDRNDSWLYRFALVYGLSIADEWGMVAFIPGFLVAMVWCKGISFFDLRFLTRVFVLWIAGVALLLLFPLIASFARIGHVDFWQGIRSVLTAYKYALGSVPRNALLLMCLTSVVPTLLVGIKWSSQFGDTSDIGIIIATSAFHFVHALFLFVSMWIVLGSPISPRYVQGAAYSYPYLPLYYLVALNIGYFSGYFLLIFGNKIPKARYRPHPLMQLINRCVIVSIWLLLVAVPGLLFYRSLTRISAAHSDSLRRYVALVESSLPPEGAVVLSDDPYRLFYLEVLLNEKGRRSSSLLLYTGSLGDPSYFKLLDRQHLQFKLTQVFTNPPSQLVYPQMVLRFLNSLSRDHKIFYLQPSFGHYFEVFYLQPHGLVYQMKPLPEDNPILPPPSVEVVAENQSIWQSAEKQEFPSLVRALHPPDVRGKPNLLEKFVKKIHLVDESDSLAKTVGGYYSRAVDYWGVEMQKTGAYTEAARYFSDARDLNPENVSAQVNLEFNADLQAGKKPVLHMPKEMEERFGTHRKFDELVQEGGPFDEPSFCYLLGMTFAQAAQFNQAIQLFDRVQTIAPGMTGAPQLITRFYAYTQNYSNSLATAEAILQKSTNDPTALFFKGISLIQLHDYRGAIPALTRVVEMNTNNVLAQLNRAIAYFQLDELDAARQDYEAITKAVPEAFQAYFGLAQIADRQKDAPAAINYYRLYIKNAPTNTDEFKAVGARLKELEAAKPGQK